MRHINTAFTVSVDFSEKDEGVMLVARQDEKTKKVEIMNAFVGEEAYELFQRLITKPADRMKEDKEEKE